MNFFEKIAFNIRSLVGGHFELDILERELSHNLGSLVKMDEDVVFWHLAVLSFYERFLEHASAIKDTHYKMAWFPLLQNKRIDALHEIAVDNVRNYNQELAAILVGDSRDLLLYETVRRTIHYSKGMKDLNARLKILENTKCWYDLLMKTHTITPYHHGDTHLRKIFTLDLLSPITSDINMLLSEMLLALPSNTPTKYISPRHVGKNIEKSAGLGATVVYPSEPCANQEDTKTMVLSSVPCITVYNPDKIEVRVLLVDHTAEFYLSDVYYIAFTRLIITDKK